MTESQTLLGKIASLRERLEQAQVLMKEADGAASALLKKGDPKGAMRRRVEASAKHQTILETALRQLPDLANAGTDGASLPRQLTSRTGRLLQRVNELIGQLKTLATDEISEAAKLDPLPPFYRETASITDAVLRTVQAFPESATTQSRLCQGLEAILAVVSGRLAVITATQEQREHEARRCDELAGILKSLTNGRTIEYSALEPLAESVLQDARENGALRFPQVEADDLPRHVAAHCIAVAQVMARLTRHDSQWRGKPLEPIIAALVHDLGMLRVPATLLMQKGPLTLDQRRLVERHSLLGAEMAARIRPSAGWLVESVGQHHERLDGRGYPAGLRDLQIKPLVRLLAVCDVYAALCQPRSYRAALDTRTALTDTLLLAEKGELDAGQAERLLQLSFYPVGTLVELSDGSVGEVIANHSGRGDFNILARPVVAVLVDAHDQPLALSRHVDLAAVEGLSVLRGLTDRWRVVGGGWRVVGEG